MGGKVIGMDILSGFVILAMLLVRAGSVAAWGGNDENNCTRIRHSIFGVQQLRSSVMAERVPVRIVNGSRPGSQNGHDPGRLFSKRQLRNGGAEYDR